MSKQMVEFWFDLMFWWIPRESHASKNCETTAASVEAALSEELAPEPATDRVAADLTVIKGIGPALQKKLAAMNIITYSDLAEADVDALMDRLKGSQPISPTQVHAWTDSARELAQA